jgi:bifunctional UDP-N-acetylglucosamine pyrophosphorylase / glucosamine-1-phosphate N-acetyltransferase
VSNLGPVTAPIVVILAAGQGTRMRSRVPKMLHDICGRPMIDWTVAAARESGAGSVVVVGSPGGALEGRLADGVALAIQPRADGTGGAVLAAADHLGGDGAVLVVNGDAPLVTPDALRALADAHAASGAAATIVTTTLDDPTGYGRVVRGADGGVERVVETKRPGDATADELAIAEVNAGVYAFDRRRLLDALQRVGTDNAQGELYLPAALAVLRAGGARVEALTLDDPSLLLGVNDRVELARVRRIAQRRIHEAHMRAGVTIVDPDTTTIELDVRIGADTVIEPSTFLRGATAIGEDCTVGPLTTAIDAVLGDGVSVVHSYVHGCEVRAGGTVGPFAYLRPGALLRERAKAGTFVEIKNSDIGARTKVPHLSYVGDADVGEDTNIGAGNITANYDGRRKHRTKIGSRVKTSVDTAFVAPVTVGDDAYTGAGSVITKDVPEGALGIARERQRNVEGYAKRREEEAR